MFELEVCIGVCRFLFAEGSIFITLPHSLSSVALLVTSFIQNVLYVEPHLFLDFLELLTAHCAL
jgi:hypothetical protein